MSIPLASTPPTGYNVLVMSSFRLAIALLFVSALVFTAAESWCAEKHDIETIDQQIAERTQQYLESLRQRSQQLSPSLQEKIETQTQQTIAQGLKMWKNGELPMRIALPRWTEAKRITQFVARHLPGSHSPAGSLDGRTGNCVAVLTVTTVPHVVKSFTSPVADSLSRHCVIGLLQHDNNVLSLFIQVVCTIVQRQ